MAQFFEGLSGSSTISVLNEQAPALPLREGNAVFTVGAGANTTVIVPDARLTANSIIVLTPIGAVNATALTFKVDNVLFPPTASAGFTIYADAAATVNAKTVRWAILKY